MDKITPQDVYLPVDVNERLPENSNAFWFWEYGKQLALLKGEKITHWLEKQTRIVLTPEELEEIKKKAFTQGQKSRDWDEYTKSENYKTNEKTKENK